MAIPDSDDPWDVLKRIKVGRVLHRCVVDYNNNNMWPDDDNKMFNNNTRLSRLWTLDDDRRGRDVQYIKFNTSLDVYEPHSMHSAPKQWQSNGGGVGDGGGKSKGFCQS